MYIKQVIIQGFRSYRDQTIIEPFSPQHNVIVGRNGSGKSNFFFAIQFVLSDEFSNMRQEDRQALLHEGTGARVVSAFVEIIFDNSDNRLPIDKEEVTLRRVIGSKKDQYFLDKKNATKTDVMNLLESAGFSRSNPYYIVKQGKINQLAVAKDKERLQLLREVAGTRVYDQKKEESRSLLKDSEGKIEKIEELLKYIEERLETLEEEKEELKAYQKWDKERRCLEYTIHDKELKETKEKLEKLESSRQVGADQSHEYHKKASDLKDRIELVTHGIKELSDHIQSVTVDKQQLQEECQEQIKQKAKLDLKLRDLETSVSDDKDAKDDIKQQLAVVEREIQSQEQRLEQLMPDYSEQCRREEELTSGLKMSEQRRTDLFAKQGRKTQFNTREERDQWLKTELDSLQKNASKKHSQINAMATSVQELMSELDNLQENITSRTGNLEDRRKQMDETNKKHAEAKKVRDNLTNKRKELWREEATVEQSLQSLKEECRKVEQNLRSCFSKAVVNGLESVKQIVHDKEIRGVYGPLIENFRCEEKFHTCVEVTAGNKLSQIIVDTDKTASEILSHMNKNKMRGEVSFLPLNRLHVTPSQFPQQSSDVIPMINKIIYDEEYEKAMQHAFGKTLICRDIDVAAKYAKSENLDCITLYGDQVSRRGALTGGYYDSRASRLALQKRIWELEDGINTESEKSDELKKSLQETDAAITNVLGELQKLETKQVELRETYEKQKMDVKDFSQQKQTKEQTLQSKQRTMAKLQKDLDGCKRAIKGMSEELGTELLSQLNPEDQQELAQLNESIREYQESLKETLRRRTECEKEKNTIENMLASNLMRRKEELIQSLEEISVENRQQQLETCGVDWTSVSEAIKKSKKREKELERNLDKAMKEKTEQNHKLEELQNEEREVLEAIQSESKNMEKTANKRSLLMKKKDECMKKIRELGSLPADAFQKYAKVNLKMLWKKLHNCNEELKKYSHVNKKALDQFVNFSEQKEKLLKRKDELDKGYQSIVELMDVLEHRKHEAILFTFKQVTHHFAEVFKELVPRGKATLVMKTEEKPDRQEEDEDSVSSSAGSSQKSMPQVDQFSGISIKVSFTGKSAETREMNQLSGGQKSLVALTMIFAIQKCDPAPFYLFDEIDQALDPQYRKAVAEMIRKLALKAQFITTTFRPELLESADKFYGVKFRNKVSHILAISSEEAKDFIDDDDSHGGK